MLLTFDQVGEALDDLADAFPPVLFDGLNGGVNLLEDAVPDTEFPAGEMYILGEYCDDLLGKYITVPSPPWRKARVGMRIPGWTNCGPPWPMN